MSSSRDLPDPGTELVSDTLLHWQAGSSPLAAPGPPPGERHTAAEPIPPTAEGGHSGIPALPFWDGVCENLGVQQPGL